MTHVSNYEVRGDDQVVEVDSIRIARDISQCVNDNIWDRILPVVEKSPTHIQYNVIPNDVLRYEDLFDMEETEKLGILLTNKDSTLGKNILDRVQQAMVYRGELTAEETHLILTDMDELDLLEGISLRKINIECITEILSII